MTFEKTLNDLMFNHITTKEARDAITKPDKMKTINYYLHFNNISTEPMDDAQLQELQAIVGVLATLYDSNVGSPISDENYDILQEMLVDMGIPRNTGSVELNDQKKVSHTNTRLRGTLDKIYSVLPGEKRINKSQKSLDEWIKSTEARYEKATGKKIDLNSVKIVVQSKLDGCSCCAETENGKQLWITRGDTATNRASDVTKIMHIFDDVYPVEDGGAAKFEVMMPEESKDKINELYRTHPYRNSRQVVISIFNSVEPDFKCDYLYPVPLRIMHPGDDIESIHPVMLEKFPTVVCTFGDRDIIKKFANEHRYVEINGVRLRTDGAVLTIIDKDICRALGRDNNINNYEVAYKFTAETAISKVRDVEFYVSEFGYITPVLVVNDVIMKGNTVNHISLSNKERFDELGLCYGDQVKVHYDIIPYVTVDEDCEQAKNGRKIKFIERCPCCHEELDLDQVEVQCRNPECPSRIIGRILNYCKVLRIKNIGYNTIETLYAVGLLEHGIRSLYKLKKHTHEVEDLDGFGKLKTRKMVGEIEAKRRLKDYEFFGAYGIEDMATKTFQAIFQKIPLHEFLDMVRLQNLELLKAKLIQVPGISDKKAAAICLHFRNPDNQKELQKILKEVILEETAGKNTAPVKGIIVFSGCRPSTETIDYLASKGYKASDSWTNSARCLVISHSGFGSTKVDKANSKGIPVLPLDDNNIIDVLSKEIPDLK